MDAQSTTRRSAALIIRIILSVLCAGITYFLWLGLFLLAMDAIGPLVRSIFWLAAPVVTALGFAIGIFVHERVTGVRRERFTLILVWPLSGCAIGAAAIYWRGPMMIVFGMFAAGTASVILREIALSRRHV